MPEDAQSRLHSILVSYVNAHETEEGSIEELRSYIRSRGLGEIAWEDLRKRIAMIRDSRQALVFESQQLADLFTPEHEPRIYRFGSPFCPNCHLFKNYEKECPHCSFLEMTL
jgi:hypothetical protein